MHGANTLFNVVIPWAMCQGRGVRRFLKGAGFGMNGSYTDSTSAAFLPPEATQKCEIAVSFAEMFSLVGRRPALRWCGTRSRWERCAAHSRACSRTWLCHRDPRPSRAAPSSPTCPTSPPFSAASAHPTACNPSAPHAYHNLTACLLSPDALPACLSSSQVLTALAARWPVLNSHHEARGGRAVMMNVESGNWKSAGVREEKVLRGCMGAG